jgi:hypothetical protein
MRMEIQEMKNEKQRNKELKSKMHAVYVVAVFH